MKTALVLVACGERHQAMARAAAARWLDLIHPRPATTLILTDRHLAVTCLDRIPDRLVAINGLKLHMWDFLPPDIDAILYADIDTYPFRPFDLDRILHHVEFACVRDRWHHAVVCGVADAARIPRHKYFNAGFFCARRFCANAFSAARSLLGHLPYYDQTALNVAIHADTSIRIAWLPWEANAMDSDGTDHGIRLLHNPWIAYPAWESFSHPHTPPDGPSPAELIESLDYSHPWATGPDQLAILASLAANSRDALDVGTFQGHSAAVMAAAGAQVTTLDPSHQYSLRQRLHGQMVDCMAHTGEQWLRLDPLTEFDLIFHDAEHGPHIIPELELWWDRIRPGGHLAVHDAEHLAGWSPPSHTTLDRSRDHRGRELLVCSRPA